MTYPEVSREDKIRHYTATLQQRRDFWVIDRELYFKVKKAQNNESFQDECVRLHDLWKRDIRYLFPFFGYPMPKIKKKKPKVL